MWEGKKERDGNKCMLVVGGGGGVERGATPRGPLLSSPPCAPECVLFSRARPPPPLHSPGHPDHASRDSPTRSTGLKCGQRAAGGGGGRGRGDRYSTGAAGGRGHKSKTHTKINTPAYLRLAAAPGHGGHARPGRLQGDAAPHEAVLGGGLFRDEAQEDVLGADLGDERERVGGEREVGEAVFFFEGGRVWFGRAARAP